MYQDQFRVTVVSGFFFGEEERWRVYMLPMRNVGAVLSALEINELNRSVGIGYSSVDSGPTAGHC